MSGKWMRIRPCRVQGYWGRRMVGRAAEVVRSHAALLLDSVWSRRGHLASSSPSSLNKSSGKPRHDGGSMKCSDGEPHAATSSHRCVASRNPPPTSLVTCKEKEWTLKEGLAGIGFESDVSDRAGGYKPAARSTHPTYRHQTRAGPVPIAILVDADTGSEQQGHL